MGEKVEMKNEGEKKAVPVAVAADGGAKTDEGPITVVLKLDLHCQGCAKKVRRSVTNLQGVEKVKADCEAKKLTVTGNVDPTWLREKVELKTKKKVELISPQPKKDDKKAEDNKSSEKKTEEKKGDDDTKKPKEAVISTVVMKIRLHCDGCANKIKRVILKNVDGAKSVTTDLEKDLVTVIGTMDVKELTAYLKEKIQRSVEIVPPKKDDDKKGKEGSGDKKEKDGGEGEKKKQSETKVAASGGEKKESESKVAASGGGEESKGVEVTKVEVNKMEHHSSSSYNPQTHYAMPMYNQSYANQDYGVQMYNHHHPQGYSNTAHVVQYTQGPPPPPPTYLGTNDHDMFSDENPNGCSVM